MKHLIFFALTSLLTLSASAQSKLSADSVRTVEAACGECKFAMKGKGCNLAVRIDGKAYFVDGTKIDQHGDAHADDGFCNMVRKAAVSGAVVNDRFAATSFKLLPVEKAKQ